MTLLRFSIVVSFLVSACGGMVVSDDVRPPDATPQPGDPPAPGAPPVAGPGGDPGGDGPRVVLDGHSPYTLAVDGADIYFTAHNSSVLTAMKCAIAGCDAPTLLGTGGSGLPGIALDADNVYWTSNFDGKVFACPRGGCGSAPVVLASGQGTPRGIASDGRDVYWASNEGVLKCATTGCNNAPTSLSGMSDANGIALDATTVYWTKSEGGVFSCAKAGCGPTPTQLAAGSSGADVAVDATDVYWTSPWTTEVLKCAIGGCKGAPTLVAASAGYALAVDDANIYWATTSSIMKCAKAGCAQPTVVASGQSAPADIALTATNVYWTDRAAAGAIRTVPK